MTDQVNITPQIVEDSVKSYSAVLESVAAAMWKREADRAAPNVGKNRTVEGFADEDPKTRDKWLGLADAAAVPLLKALVIGENGPSGKVRTKIGRAYKTAERLRAAGTFLDANDVESLCRSLACASRTAAMLYNDNIRLRQELEGLREAPRGR